MTDTNKPAAIRSTDDLGRWRRGITKNMNREQIELSERLRKACLEKGITEPRFVAQDADGTWCHYKSMPYTIPALGFWEAGGDHGVFLIEEDELHFDWRDALMEFNPNAGVPLSEILNRTCEHCWK